MKKERYNIGLLIANITDMFSNGLAKGAIRRAKELDTDLTIFSGKYVGLDFKYEQYDTKYEYQYNVLFNLAAAAKLDYLIVAVGTIAYTFDAAHRKAFLESLGDTPILSVASEIEGYDFLEYDNRSGIAAAVDHLVKHGRKNIGFMAGNLNNSECAERFDAYKKSLERHGIEFRDKYVTECNLAHESIYDARPFIEKNPDLDAVLCVNDIVASKLYEVLSENGIRPGEDIAVVGFDDLPFCKRLEPALSSVRADAETLGAVSVEKAVSVLEGKPDERHYVETRFIPRASCPSDDAPAEESAAPKSYTVEKYEERTHLENIFIRDTLMFDSDPEKGYSQIMKQLSCIGADTAFLYVYDEPIKHTSRSRFPKKLSWLFKAYSYGEALYSVPQNEQRMSTPAVFRNKYLDSDRQHTLIAADLYTVETQYGLALLEPRTEYFLDELELVTYQLSSAVRTLDILKKQSDLLSELYIKNLALEEMSMIDELTGAYNRRGFYIEAEKLIKACPDSSFIVCYADMDNLKTVNDTFGHEEGDFCIKLVAKCLYKILGDKAVIGRMGGDEFAAIMPSGADLRPWDILAERDRFINEFNAGRNKPYKFSISLGVHDAYIRNGYDLQSAISVADNLLYIEKKEKKKREAM
ncbi:MAG: GGDEF domain-containing protein [Ruminiclostridium sp.]|nr:GGDEF domain-containing protein [Ruminiclostridium sp.]